MTQLRLTSSLLAVLAVACKPSATVPDASSERPHVVSFQPGDRVERLDQSLSFRFDREMVGIDAVGPALPAPPLTITPALPLRVHWEDRKTLMVQPETEWHRGQRYTLELQPPLRDRVIEPHRFWFDATPLRLTSTSLPRRNAPTTNDEFVGYFSLPVDPIEVQAQCALVAAAPAPQRVALVAAPRKPSDIPERVALHAATPLALGTRYRIECPALQPIGGGAPLRAEPERDSFTTHGLLTVRAHWPAQTQPPERAQLCLRFSTPVELSELKQHVHVTPEPEGLGDSWFEGTCEPEKQRDEHFEYVDTDRASSILFAARRSYHVLVDAALKDAFGQTLPHAENFDFQTSDRVPGLWTATGAGSVLELGREGHAVGSLNLSAVQLACSPLTAAELAAHFAPLLAWAGAGRASQGEGDEDAPKPPWQLLGVAPRQQRMAADAPPNAARQLQLDLGGQCGAGAGRAGLFALELTPESPLLASSGRQGDQPARLLANVTDLSVLAKRGASTAVVWVTRLSNGALVPRAEVRLLDEKGATLANARTDERGLARFAALPAPNGDEVFSVEAGADLAIVAGDERWSEGLRAWQLGARQGDDNPTQLFVHTDRGVYRPGEHVYVHGLVRAVRDGAPARIPEQRDVKLVLSDGNERFFTQALQLSDFGSFASDIALPKQLAPGEYSLDVSVAGRSEVYPIHVAEFRPLTFELTGSLQRDEVLAKQAVRLNVVARYLFGAPLSDAALHYAIERTPAELHPPELDAFRFEDSAPALASETPWPEAESGLLREEDDTADADGRSQLQFDTEPSHVPLRYLITASATDSAEDRATRTWSVLAHSAERYAGTHMLRFVYGADEPVQAEVVLIDRAGKRVAGEAHVELRRAVWKCSDPLAACDATVEELEEQTVAVAAGRPTLVTFATKTAGLVHVRASTRDAAGRVARASDAAFVWSREGTGPYEDRVAAELQVDKRGYRVGEQARLALQTPLTPQQFLMTAERGEVLSAAVVDRAAGLPAIALGPETAPNVFVSLAGMTPRTQPGELGRPRLVAGVRELHVEGPSRVLTARIVLPRDKYEPKQRVEGTVEVAHLGKPLSAEVALVAVNESVLQLTDFETPDPTRVFHAPRGLDVRTFSNVPLVVADPAAAAAVPETARLGTPGEDGLGGKPDVRNDYVAAAYVAPALRTGADGKVSFAFDAPSDLSAYRLMAVVAAKDDRVGSADRRFTVSQPIAAHVIAPRFVSRGDQLEIGALVHDTTEQPGATQLRFTAEGLKLAQATAEVKATPAGAAVRTRAEVQDVDRASFEVELHKGDKADRVRHDFDVRRPLDTELRVLALGRAARANAALSWPPGIDPQRSRLEITLDRAGLAPLAPLLAMVFDYPYGCTEQTAAALSALAAAPELARAIAPYLVHKVELSARVADGIERMRAARAPDGRFGLYPGMSGRIWLTALVFEASLALETAGFSVPNALTGDVAAVLSQWLGEQDLAKLAPADLERSAQIIWLLTAAGRAPKAALDRLVTLSARLTRDGLAYALHAAALDHRPEATRAALRQPLMAADWLTRERDVDEPLSSAERTSALVLSALVRDGGAPELAKRLATWLGERAADPERYLSTRDVAEVLRALAAWAHDARAGAGHARVSLGKRVLWEGTLQGAEVIALNEPAAAATPGALALESDAPISFSMRRRDVSPSAPKPAFAHGITLERRYLEPRSDERLSKVALGDVVQVELELRTERPLRMLALTDPLPAGLEPLDPGLTSGRFAGCESCNLDESFGYVQRHDDRIEAFAEWLPAGTHSIRYLLRATTAGTFSAPGASAQLMYMPDTFGRSQVDQLAIERR
jgi:uncharacterized protein YfaS (alpha-2-macroglobulin family)